ncbi:MAG: response regulator [Candidatus Rokubacteria bacterium]|nr:response regulator [Candidatus Rokubacteria bacterium]
MSTGSESSLKGLRVLLVEDAAETREALTWLLEAEGAAVTPAALGRPALEAASGTDFDVLLTDLGLPDIPGDLFIRHVLETAARRPAVIAMTAHAEPHRQRALDAGAEAVLGKPFEWSVLRGLLLLSARRAAA